jgi:ubiquitin-conjugating enzyme E2 O
MDSAPSSHKFKLTMFQPTDPQNFFRTVRKEIKLLRSSLPPGIWVKGFEDRMVSIFLGGGGGGGLFCEWHA